MRSILTSHMKLIKTRQTYFMKIFHCLIFIISNYYVFQFISSGYSEARNTILSVTEYVQNLYFSVIEYILEVIIMFVCQYEI